MFLSQGGPGIPYPPIHLRWLVRYHSRLLIDGLIDWPQKYLHILDVHMCILECRIKHSSAEKTTNCLVKCLDEARDQDSNERDRDQDQGSDPQDQDRAGKKIVSRRDSVSRLPITAKFLLILYIINRLIRIFWTFYSIFLILLYYTRVRSFCFVIRSRNFYYRSLQHCFHCLFIAGPSSQHDFLPHFSASFHIRTASYYLQSPPSHDTCVG